MAIAFDASVLGPNTLAASPQTWSHTTSGTNRILFVGAISTADTITGVTYNSVAMTLIGKTSYPGVGRQGVALFYLINPTSGANTVSVTGSSTVSGFSSSFTGAQQSGQPDSFAATNPADGANLVMTTTVVASNCWLVACEADGAGGETAGAGTTIRQTHSFALTLSDSNGTVGTGSQSLTINFASNKRAGIVASFSPAAAAATSNFLSSLGAGS